MVDIPHLPLKIICCIIYPGAYIYIYILRKNLNGSIQGPWGQLPKGQDSYKVICKILIPFWYRLPNSSPQLASSSPTSELLDLSSTRDSSIFVLPHSCLDAASASAIFPCCIINNIIPGYEDNNLYTHYFLYCSSAGKALLLAKCRATSIPTI